MLKKLNVSKIIVFINKIDEVAEEDRAVEIQSVKDDVSAMLEECDFYSGNEIFAVGSAWDAINEKDTEIGLQSIQKLNAMLNNAVSPTSLTEHRALKRIRHFDKSIIWTQ